MWVKGPPPEVESENKGQRCIRRIPVSTRAYPVAEFGPATFALDAKYPFNFGFAERAP